MKPDINKAKVVVALSGGVDSSTAAALLVKQGFEVIAVTMRLWSEPGCEMDNRCCTPETRDLARRQAEKLGIPFRILDASDIFFQEVVGAFLDGYSCGDTPNPCLICNQRIKWGFLLNHARQMNADYIATGHYARIHQTPQGTYELWRGVDRTKDQSYFLCLLDQPLLARTIFPLGEMRKDQIRELAQEWALPAADQPESQDLCFLGGMDYRTFLQKYVPQVAKPGEVISRSGQSLGEHLGLAFYTIGQRKRLPASTRPLYVLHKDLLANKLVVGFEEELGQQELTAGSVNWIAGEPPGASFNAQVKIRYKAHPAAAQIALQPDNSALVRFEQPLRDITPGQMAVFYTDDRVLGGGVIRPYQLDSL